MQTCFIILQINVLVNVYKFLICSGCCWRRWPLSLGYLQPHPFQIQTPIPVPFPVQTPTPLHSFPLSTSWRSSLASASPRAHWTAAWTVPTNRRSANAEGAQQLDSLKMMRTRKWKWTRPPPELLVITRSQRRRKRSLAAATELLIPHTERRTLPMELL